MEAILLLIAKYGIPLASQIYTTVSQHYAEGQVVSPVMWDKLLALENQSHADFVKALSVPVPSSPLPPVP